MNKKPDTMVDAVEKFIKQKEKEFGKAITDPVVADVLTKSPETAALYQVSAMLQGILLVQANIVDRLTDIERILMKEDSK